MNIMASSIPVRILIACHCMTPIYDEEEDEYMSPSLRLISPLHAEIYYIDYDERCFEKKPLQYNNWESIPKNFFDYVWLENCPIWIKTSNNAELIFDSAYKVLKKSGKLISGFLTVYNTEEDQTEYLLSKINKKQYDFEIIDKDSEELPFYFVSTREGEKEEPSYDKFFILSKVVSGGRRKTLRKTKRKTKSRKSRKSQPRRRALN